jgi:uncharacterized protein YbbK (DUF523 family)
VPPARVLVSACLLGAEVRYHGGSAREESPILRRWRAEGRVVGVCPEVAGGLGTPRPAAELTRGGGLQVLRGDGSVLTRDGEDVTAALVAGARQAVAVARELRIAVAVLKEGSPSCGTRDIYDGHFRGGKVADMGVTAAALADAGVRVFSENQLQEADAALRALDGSTVDRRDE